MHLGLAPVVLAPVIAARAIAMLSTPMRSRVAIAIPAALAALLAVRTPIVATFGLWLARGRRSGGITCRCRCSRRGLGWRGRRFRHRRLAATAALPIALFATLGPAFPALVPARTPDLLILDLGIGGWCRSRCRLCRSPFGDRRRLNRNGLGDERRGIGVRHRGFTSRGGSLDCRRCLRATRRGCGRRLAAVSRRRR